MLQSLITAFPFRAGGTRVLPVGTRMGFGLQPMFNIVTMLPAAFLEQVISDPCNFVLSWLNGGVKGFLFHRSIGVVG